MRALVLVLVVGCSCSSRPLALPEPAADLGVRTDLALPDLSAADLTTPAPMDLSSMDLSDLAGADLLHTRCMPHPPATCSFGPAVSYHRTAGTTAVAAGDFDEDGRDDLLVANAFSDDLDVLLGGASGFRHGVTIATAGLRWSSSIGYRPLAVADFDGDGHLDFVLGGNAGLSLFWGRGDGSFETGVVLAVPDQYVFNLAAGDFDGDGAPDLAIGGSSKLFVLLNAGGRGFASPVQLTLPHTASDVPIAIADFDGDHQLDLVAGERYFGAAVFLGAGDGSFGAPVETMFVSAVNLGIIDITVGDFDEDGISDAAFADYQGPALWVARSSGGGQLTVQSVPLQGAEPWIQAADVDGDGHLDVALPIPEAGALDVFLGDGKLGFTETTRSAVGINPMRAAIGDFDGDGREDTAWADSGGSVDLVFADRVAQVPDAIYSAVGGVNVLATGDLDGDGHLDLIFGDRFSESLNVWRGLGGTMFQPVLPLRRLQDWPSSLQVGAFRTGAPLDVAASLYLGGTVRELPGRGDGTFAAGSTVASTVDSLLPAMGDFDGDGRPDLVARTFSGTELLLGQGDGSFSVGATLPTFVTALAADFDGDGRSDLAALAPDQSFTVYLSRGSGFQASETRMLANTRSNSIQRLAVGDFDCDGAPDLAWIDVAYPSSGQIGVALGRGDGSFTDLPAFSTTQAVWALYAADLDGDGVTDLIGTGLGPAVQAWLGQGGGAFGSPIALPGANTRTLLADLDGDGRPELIQPNAAFGPNVWPNLCR